VRFQRRSLREGRLCEVAQDAHVYVVEDTDPTPVDQISWCKVVHTPSRPFGQNTNLHLLSHHQQGFGIVTCSGGETGASWTLLAAEVRQSTRGCALETVTAPSWLTCDCIEWMKMTQV
jgi:hypothetical protein